MKWPWRRTRWAVVARDWDTDGVTGVYGGFRNEDQALRFGQALATETQARDDADAVTCTVLKVRTL